MLLPLTFLLCGLAVGTLGWLNKFDQPVFFQCPANQFLSHISSAHDNHYEDRVWDMSCSPLPPLGKGWDSTVRNCRWTNYVNELDQPLTFQCPNEGFITGMASFHDDKTEDRRFKFQCCDAPGAGVVAHSCYFTSWANDWDGTLNFDVPRGKILRGVISYHSNAKEDRRFKFEICDLDFLCRRRFSRHSSRKQLIN